MENSCSECQKFGITFERIKYTLAETWGKPSKHKWFLETFIPGAIKVLEKIAKHCQRCVDDFNQREKSMKNLGLIFPDYQAEKKERDRHQQILFRCHQVLAALESCKYYGKDQYHEACVKGIEKA
jgi:hypothetical protein